MQQEVAHGPTSEVARRIHAEKYRGPGESFEEAMNRVAGALAEPRDYHGFRDALLNQRFLPAGRIQAAAGAAKRVTPYNCYVSGRIEDSFVEGEGSIMKRAHEAAATMRMGGGIGYDFSTLRPRGDTIRQLGSRSSGPISFMEIFDAVCRCVASSGHRRGAQMGVMRVDHPDIEEFIHAKQNQDRLTGFNISVMVTDEFMKAVKADGPFQLRFGGRPYREVRASALWESIMRSTWDWAEPGVLFYDTIQRMNNLHYCEEIAATNPCGEQPLPPFGACLLGSFNLVKYIHNPFFASFDWDLFRRDIRIAVRAMDRVVDIASYPLPEQEHEAKSKRRMGLGVTGLANALEALGFPYGTDGFLAFQADVLRVLRDEAYRASIELAIERGPFPALDREAFLASGFALTLPAPIRDLIRLHGIRNSHLLSIAPTGTISLCADNVSSGIEPVFSLRQRRIINTEDGPVELPLVDYGLAHFGVEGQTSSMVPPERHLEVLAVASRFVDSAVSKTINLDNRVSWEDFKGIYVRAWELGCKGCTTFNKDGQRFAILSEDTGAACRVDPKSGKRECE